MMKQTKRKREVKFSKSRVGLDLKWILYNTRVALDSGMVMPDKGNMVVPKFQKVEVKVGIIDQWLIVASNHQ